MVRVQRASKGNNSTISWKKYLPAGILLGLILVLIPMLFQNPEHEKVTSLSRLGAGETTPKEQESAVVNGERALSGGKESSQKIDVLSPKDDEGSSIKQCPYRLISDLADEEQNPVKGPRHMVTPPEGGSLHLVCCQTTKGPLNFVVHPKWAPFGAQRVLEMVKTGYFNAGVPMMRCLRRFLCQFGLNSDPNLSKNFRKNLPDDPNWLPEGPSNRKNEEGVVRFAHGYMAYAGGGKDSRTNQLIVSLQDVQSLAGGSPWEVPWGELVGKHSFETLSKIYTGYGEKGPPQGKLWNRGMTEEMKKEFPELDYITACSVVDEKLES